MNCLTNIYINLFPHLNAKQFGDLRLRFFVRRENIWHKADAMTILLVVLALLLAH